MTLCSQWGHLVCAIWSCPPLPPDLLYGIIIVFQKLRYLHFSILLYKTEFSYCRCFLLSIRAIISVRLNHDGGILFQQHILWPVAHNLFTKGWPLNEHTGEWVCSGVLQIETKEQLEITDFKGTEVGLLNVSIHHGCYLSFTCTNSSHHDLCASII